MDCFSYFCFKLESRPKRKKEKKVYYPDIESKLAALNVIKIGHTKPSDPKNR
jgi:hypothetical protein